ncbi:MAG: hypothetical protein HN389_11845 [Clostridia bacterium]|jgi:hypothetical protein|nr:hypothetical protein [Clostridia bacterium]
MAEDLPDSLIITHTSNVLDYLKDNIGILYYLQEEKWHVMKFIWDQMIRKNPKGIRRIEILDIAD